MRQEKKSEEAAATASSVSLSAVSMGAGLDVRGVSMSAPSQGGVNSSSSSSNGGSSISSSVSSSLNGSLGGSLNGNLAERPGGTRTAWQSPRSGRVVNEQKNSSGRGPEPEPTLVNATIRLRPASTPLPSTRGLGDDEDPPRLHDASPTTASSAAPRNGAWATPKPMPLSRTAPAGSVGRVLLSHAAPCTTPPADDTSRLGRLADAVLGLLDEARRYGDVVIVSNADDAWLRRSSRHFLGNRWSLFAGTYPVISARPREAGGGRGGGGAGGAGGAGSGSGGAGGAKVTAAAAVTATVNSTAQSSPFTWKNRVSTHLEPKS